MYNDEYYVTPTVLLCSHIGIAILYVIKSVSQELAPTRLATEPLTPPHSTCAVRHRDRTAP